MFSQSDESTAVHVQPAFAAAYQRTRLQANAVLLRYGHIIPVAAILICLLVSGTISIAREVQYSHEAKAKNATTTTTTTTTTTAAPVASTQPPTSAPEVDSTLQMLL